MLRAGKPLSELVGVMTVYPQELVNVDVVDKPDLDTVPAIRAVVDEVEQKLGEEGRVLVRYSGTQPLCRIMVEGPSIRTTRAACRRIADAVQREIGVGGDGRGPV